MAATGRRSIPSHQLNTRSTPDAGAAALSDHERRLWRSFLSAHAKIAGQVGAELQTMTGLSVKHFEALSELSYGALRMRELADRLWITRGGLTRLIERLELHGYVERHADEHDGRAIHAVITPCGVAALEAARDQLAPTLRRLFLDPLDGEHATMYDLLGRLLSHDARRSFPRALRSAAVPGSRALAPSQSRSDTSPQSRSDTSPQSRSDTSPQSRSALLDAAAAVLSVAR